MWTSLSHWGMFDLPADHWEELPLVDNGTGYRAAMNFYGYAGAF